MSIRKLTKEQTAWLGARPRWKIVSGDRHAKDYARAANDKGKWKHDILLCPDGSTLPGDSYPLAERVYVRPPAKKMNWRKIDNAPKNGTKILLADYSGYHARRTMWISSGYWVRLTNIGFWTDGVEALCTPTHWKPLPPPPRT